MSFLKPKAPKAAPVPKAAAVQSPEMVGDVSRETIAKKKKKKFGLSDTMSIFDENSPGGSAL